MHIQHFTAFEKAGYYLKHVSTANYVQLDYLTYSEIL